MGPVRRGLTLALLWSGVWPGVAWAQVCADVRPDWDGAPTGMLSEALYLLGTLPVLAMIVATLAAFRFRSQWAGLVVFVLWTILITFLTMVDPGGLQAAARAEGCVGSPALFICVVAAICVAMIMYTAPVKKQAD